MKEDNKNYPPNSVGKLKQKLSGKTKSFLIVISILLLFCVTVGISYAYWKFSGKQNVDNLVNTACIEITLTSETNAITLQSAHPITNADGEKLSPYIFSVKNTCKNTLEYNVSLEVLEVDARMESKNIALKIDEDTPKMLTNYTNGVPTYNDGTDYAVENFILKTGRIKGGETITHKVRIWIHESAGNDSQNKVFNSKVSINATTPNEILDTPKILIYKDSELLKEIESQEEKQEYLIYSETDVKAVASGFSNNNKLYYNEEPNGEKSEMINNELMISPSPEGTVRYIYVEDSNNYVKLIITNKDEVTPPVITGGNEVFATNRTIQIETPGSATSGVSHYEYYISDTEDVPNADVTATNTSGDANITTEGTHYIFYRTVGNSGIKSEWSNSQKINIFYRARSVPYTNNNDSSIKNVQEALDTIYSFFK